MEAFDGGCSNSSNGNDDQTADPAVPILVDPLFWRLRLEQPPVGESFFLSLTRMDTYGAVVTVVMVL